MKCCKILDSLSAKFFPTLVRGTRCDNINNKKIVILVVVQNTSDFKVLRHNAGDAG